METSPRSVRTRPRARDDVIPLAIRLGVLVFLIYWTYVLVRPFIPLLVWSVVLAAALYPIYDWLAGLLGGRRRLAAALVTLLTLAIVVGPVAWLGFGLVDGLRDLSQQLAAGTLAVPPPAATVKAWPLIGPQVYEAWELASDNLAAALRDLAPHLKPMAGTALDMARNAGAGALVFLASVVVAGFLFSPGPRLVDAVRSILQHVVPERTNAFVALAGATIRSVSRGVIGVAALQALVVGIGFKVAGVPGASVLTFLALALGIVQIGSSIVVIPAIIWYWTAAETVPALLFTAYMIPASLLDNVLKPIVMGHGLKTPALVILIGVIGGTLAHGMLGLFIGPIVLAVAWELLAAWARDDVADHAPQGVEDHAASPERETARSLS